MRWFVWGVGRAQSPLLQRGEVTDAAMDAARRSGHRFDSPDAWAIQVQADGGELDRAIRFDPSVRGYVAASVYFQGRIRKKLRLRPEEFEALLVAAANQLGRHVEAEVRRRYRLPEGLPLGEALHKAGVLTAEEAAWLDDEA